ncbi:MAG TPA: hypothetical protein VFA07_17220 [Chthonomonadaceae bacterium]|nr:hypothetical protein [Chthonomonadaceae bacterium]
MTFYLPHIQNDDRMVHQGRHKWCLDSNNNGLWLLLVRDVRAHTIKVILWEFIDIDFLIPQASYCEV